MMHHNFLSIKRQQRYERKLTGGVAANGKRDRNCIHQEMTEVGIWPRSGQPKLQIRYLHVTKGWRVRILPPLTYRQVQ